MPPKKKKDDAGDEEEQDDSGWNSHPARKLLYKELSDGIIPLDVGEMKAHEVYFHYEDALEFEGMPYDDAFIRRLGSLRGQIKRDRKRAEADQHALAIARRNHPVPATNHRGEPHWNGSTAQLHLKEDIKAGEHNQYAKTEDFWKSRSSYQEFPYKVFYGHIRQEIKTIKYLHTIKERAKKKTGDPGYY